MIVCYYSVSSVVELEGAEMIQGIFLASILSGSIYFIYMNSLPPERTENVVVTS